MYCHRYTLNLTTDNTTTRSLQPCNHFRTVRLLKLLTNAAWYLVLCRHSHRPFSVDTCQPSHQLLLPYSQYACLFPAINSCRLPLDGIEATRALCINATTNKTVYGLEATRACHLSHFQPQLLVLLIESIVVCGVTCYTS